MKNLWEKCLKLLARNIQEKPFNQWIKPLHVVVSSDSSTVFIYATNRFMMDFVRSQYLGEIENTIKSVCSVVSKVDLKIISKECDEKEPPAVSQSTESDAIEVEPITIMLPLWPEPVRAVPNSFLRSALFAAVAKAKGSATRRYLDHERIASMDSLEIYYTGPQLDQGDLDVWLSVLHLVRMQALGTECRITSYQLLKLIGLTDTGKNRMTLHRRLSRLRANAVEVVAGEGGRYKYIGGLLDRAAKDEKTQEWVIRIDEKMAPLFASNQYTQTQWAIRQSLAGHPLAQWLHGYYASHAKPYPVRMDTLLEWSGGSNSSPTSARQTLRKALDAVVDASAANGEGFSYEVKDGTVEITKQPTKSQRKHLIKQKRLGK